MLAGATLRVSLISVIIFIVVWGCTNPFAPKLNDGAEISGSLITSRRTVEGVFTNFQYAYSFKDTTIYGELLNEEFSFVYRDYDKEVDVSWGREEEMRVTYGLFSNADNFDLVWNNMIAVSSDSTSIVRSFNLTITLDPTETIYIDGRVNLTLEKQPDSTWQILRWIDESNF